MTQNKKICGYEVELQSQELGAHPEDGQAVTAAMGPFGPYVRHNTINASLPKVHSLPLQVWHSVTYSSGAS